MNMMWWIDDRHPCMVITLLVIADARDGWSSKGWQWAFRRWIRRWHRTGLARDKDHLTYGDRPQNIARPSTKVIVSFIENGWPRHKRCVLQSVQVEQLSRKSITVDDWRTNNQYTANRRAPEHPAATTRSRHAKAYLNQLIPYGGHGLEKAITARRKMSNMSTKLTSPVRKATASYSVAQTAVAEKGDGYMSAQTNYDRLLFTMDRSKQLTSVTAECFAMQWCQRCLHYARSAVVVSDNGRQFLLEEFKRFADEMCFTQQMTNP